MMKSSSRFRLGFWIVVVSYLAIYVIHTTLFPRYPISSDLPNYATMMLQAENPQLYSRDPIFGDGTLTQLMQSSSYLYMRFFQWIYHLAGSNISAIMALLQITPGVLSILTFYWALSLLKQEKWLTLMCAVGASLWLLLVYSDGIPSIYYFAFLPLFLGLLWKFLLEPSLNNRPVVLWRVVLIGMMIGISPLLLNSVNGLAFNLLTLAIVTVQLLAGRMRLMSYAALLLGLIPLLGFVATSGTGGANVLQTYEAAQHLLDKLPRYNLVVGWKSSFLIRGDFFVLDDKISWVFYLPLTALITGLSLWLYWGRQSTRGTKILYITLCWLLWSWTLGNAGIVLYAYFLNRFWHQREENLDYILITGLNLGVLIGPVLMWLSLGFWDVSHWLTLAFILLQMFRFQYLTFFIALVALLLMFQNLTEKIRDPFAQRLIQLLLIITLVVQPREGPEISVQLLVFLGFTGVLMAMSNKQRFYFTRPLLPKITGRRLLTRLPLLIVVFLGVSVLAFLLTWGSQWNWNASIDTNINYLVTVGQRNEALQDQIEVDYYDMTDWLRTNTPVDSLVHFHQNIFDRSGFFRFLSQRSMLFTWLDAYEGQFNPHVAEYSRQITTDVERIPVFLIGLLAAKYDVDYLVISRYYPGPLPVWVDGKMHIPEVVHANSTYNIYQINRLSGEDVLRTVLKIKAES
jgi:hypothetical protein